MNLSAQQDAALVAVRRWLAEKSAPFFYLAGYAGTGKTTLARHFAEGFEGRTAYGAFTGKAASVMRSKGCTGATTIHRLIYVQRPRSVEELRELQEKLLTETDPIKVRALRQRIAEEVTAARRPSFTPNPDSVLKEVDLVIVDECSMVGRDMAGDLLSFSKPVLVLGDPAQLPPVGSAGFFTKGEPDYMLTEVHRTAAESPILRLATQVRQGHTPDYQPTGAARVVRRGELPPEAYAACDQILVGKNETRHATNARVRALKGRRTELPEAGERLVCLRNCHDLGLMNGDIYTTLAAARDGGDKVGLHVEAEGGGMPVEVEAWRAPLLGQDLQDFDHTNKVQEFAFGYVLTVHKSQGSEFARVAVFDESRIFRAAARSWLYTAVTRASEELILVR